jgi:hypothetical protein
MGQRSCIVATNSCIFEDTVGGGIVYGKYQ